MHKRESAKKLGPPAEQIVTVDYVNHLGETEPRRLVPMRIWFGETGWHPGEQWLIEAYDVDKDVCRSFALSAISAFSGHPGDYVLGRSQDQGAA